MVVHVDNEPEAVPLHRPVGKLLNWAGLLAGGSFLATFGVFGHDRGNGLRPHRSGRRKRRSLCDGTIRRV